MNGEILVAAMALIVLGIGGVMIVRLRQEQAGGRSARSFWSPAMIISLVVLGTGAILFAWFVVGALTMEPAVAV